jgi:hypothetical protein
MHEGDAAVMMADVADDAGHGQQEGERGHDEEETAAADLVSCEVGSFLY